MRVRNPKGGDDESDTVFFVRNYAIGILPLGGTGCFTVAIGTFVSMVVFPLGDVVASSSFSSSSSSRSSVP
jgi:hypothetical protein